MPGEINKKAGFGGSSGLPCGVVHEEGDNGAPTIEGAEAEDLVVKEISEREMVDVASNEEPKVDPKAEVEQALEAPNLSDDEPRVPHHCSIEHRSEALKEGLLKVANERLEEICEGTEGAPAKGTPSLGLWSYNHYRFGTYRGGFEGSGAARLEPRGSISAAHAYELPLILRTLASHASPAARARRPWWHTPLACRNGHDRCPRLL